MARSGAAGASRTLVLGDGGLESLLACAWVRERLAADGTPPDAQPPILLPWTERLTEAHVEAVISHAATFGLSLVESLPEVSVQFAPAGMRELTHRLLAAAHHAARLGCDQVVWPACAGLGEGIDVDRAAAIEDLAWLVSRLVALDATQHGVPSIHVTTPFVHFSALQMAELIMDMDLDPASCWWWEAASVPAGASDAAAKERASWLLLLERAGVITR
ncbi:MAG: hypothetical protein NTV94_14515 [Planctomycetota bacterium]|nr:hypothetical protein [Planctomycetota bacterium]